jgi:hypothetical protein
MDPDKVFAIDGNINTSGVFLGVGEISSNITIENNSVVQLDDTSLINYYHSVPNQLHDSFCSIDHDQLHDDINGEDKENYGEDYVEFKRRKEIENAKDDIDENFAAQLVKKRGRPPKARK